MTVGSKGKKMQSLKDFRLPTNFRGRSSVVVQIWWLVQSTLFACSPQFMYGWRRLLLRIFGAEIGCGVLIRPSAKITYPWKLRIGDYSWIGDNVELYTLGKITIGKNSVVSQRSYLCTGSHDYKKSTFDIFQREIVVEDEVWIAADVFIFPGITIAKGAVIGARSVVYRDMPTGMLCMGSPAAPIRPRSSK